MIAVKSSLLIESHLPAQRPINLEIFARFADGLRQTRVSHLYEGLVAIDRRPSGANDVPYDKTGAKVLTKVRQHPGPTG